MRDGVREGERGGGGCVWREEEGLEGEIRGEIYR